MKTMIPGLRANMDALIELSQVRRRLSPISVEEYHHTGEYNLNFRRTELVRGIVIEKPHKTPRYCSIDSNLRDLVSKWPLDGSVARHCDPLTFRDSEPEPDLAIVRGVEEDYWESHPTTAALAVEIVDGDVEVERLLVPIYAEAQVDEYWIILANDGTVEVYRNPLDGVYRDKSLVGLDGKLACMSVPGSEVPVADIFA